MTRDAERRMAIIALLLVPDEATLVSLGGRPRGYAVTARRSPFVSADVIKRDLGIAYVERRRHEHGRDISEANNVRHGIVRKLRVV